MRAPKKTKQSVAPPRVATRAPYVDDANGFAVVDGGVMEGGGQILRITVALSCLLQRPLRVVNIRANRPRGGGLRAQHLHGIELCAQLHDAKLEGAAVSSTSITITPRAFRAGATNATADTRTAGSICLLAQIALPCAVFAPNALTLTLRGGTNATQAPPCEYLEHVSLPVFARMGVVADVRVKRRGFFPKGGGEVLLQVQPVAPPGLQALQLVGQRGPIRRVTVYAFHTPPAVNADGVSLDVVRGLLHARYGGAVEVQLQLDAVAGAADRACGVTAVAESEAGFLFGATQLAEEKSRDSLLDLLRKAIDDLVRNAPAHEAWVCVDEYLQDQLVIFAALAHGTSAWQLGAMTMHTKTAVYFAGRMSGAAFRVFRVEADGSRTVVDVATDTCDYEKEHPQSRFLIECDGIGK